MKNIEWLKEEVEGFLVPYDDEGYLSYTAGNTDVAKLILGLIDQLDEPETLSQKWIENHTASAYTIAHYSEEDVPVVTVSDLQNLLVPKQELPVIPKFVAEWIEKYVEYGYDLYPALKEMENNARSWERIYDWYRNNTLEFVLAYLTQEYEVVEEQKYRIHFGNHKYAQRFNEKWLSSQITDKEFASTFTKEEIIKLDNGDLYWNNFAKEVTE